MVGGGDGCSYTSLEESLRMMDDCILTVNFSCLWWKCSNGLEWGVVRQSRSVVLHKWGSLWRSGFEGPRYWRSPTTLLVLIIPLPCGKDGINDGRETITVGYGKNRSVESTNMLGTGNDCQRITPDPEAVEPRMVDGLIDGRWELTQLGNSFPA